MHYLKGVPLPTRSLDDLTVLRHDRGSPQVVEDGVDIDMVRDAIVYLREEEDLPKEDIEVKPTSEYEV